MDMEGPAMPFDDTARALNAQAASGAERSLRAVTGNRAGDTERHSVFPGRRGHSDRMQVRRQLPEQREQIFEKRAAASGIEAHQRQSASQFEMRPRFALRGARVNSLDNQLF